MSIIRNLFAKIKALLNSRTRIVIAGIMLIVLVYAGWNIFGNKPQQPQYQTAQAEKGTLVTSVSASGNISTGASATINTSATGIVTQVYVKNGDAVTQGQKIADVTLDQDSLQRQTAALASYQSAQNNLNTAKSKMNSLQSALFKANQTFVNDKGVANPIVDDPKYIEERADWLQAESDYNNQAGVISQAQTALTSLWLSYQQISPSITAPASGIISNLTIAPGLSISGNQTSSSNTSSNSTGNSSNNSSSQSVGEITLPSGQLQATVNLSEIDVTKVKPGQKATITLDAFPNQTFTGKVLSINTNGQVSSGVTTYPTTIVLDNNLSNIYPNMAATAKIITNIKDNVILVPSAAVQTANGQSTVRVLKNGQVTQVAVTVGDSNDTEAEITSGINVGDTVITSVLSTTGTTSQGGSSPFSSFSGGRGFGGGGGAVFRAGR